MLFARADHFDTHLHCPRDVMDYDDFTSDDLIGRTVIDLEDRWFDSFGWQQEGAALQCDEPGKVSQLISQTAATRIS